jgi:hypothetical protein
MKYVRKYYKCELLSFQILSEGKLRIDLINNNRYHLHSFGGAELLYSQDRGSLAYVCGLMAHVEKGSDLTASVGQMVFAA